MAGRLVDAGLLDGPIQTAAQEVLAPALQVAQKQLLGHGLKRVVGHLDHEGREWEKDVVIWVASAIPGDEDEVNYPYLETTPSDS